MSHDDGRVIRPRANRSGLHPLPGVAHKIRAGLRLRRQSGLEGTQGTDHHTGIFVDASGQHPALAPRRGAGSSFRLNVAKGVIGAEDFINISAAQHQDQPRS